MTVLSLRFRGRHSARRCVSAAERRLHTPARQEAAFQRLAARHDGRTQASRRTRGFERCVTGGTLTAARRVRRAAHHIGDTAYPILDAIDRFRVAAHPIPVAAGLVCAAGYYELDAAFHTAVAACHPLVAACHKTKATHRIRVTAYRPPAATRRSTRRQTPPPKCGARPAIPHLPQSALDCPPRTGVSPRSRSDCPPFLKLVRRPKSHGWEHVWEPSLLRKLFPHRAAIAPIPAKRRQAGSLSVAPRHHHDERLSGVRYPEQQRL